jgi:hypothetical protein
MQEITAERHRQIDEEGWSGEHDDRHTKGELAKAAEFYLGNGTWPWAWEVGHPPRKKNKPRRRQLIIAAALIVAEIERMERAGEA